MASRTPSGQIASSHSTWSSRSHIAIFVRCLHLLDLDLLDDWPGVTEQLFTAKAAQQNLQQRVKAVEWSLYRLSEIFDREETRDKLRPFFPPATQLQSLNLRAALYRSLTELKKNGVLGKDAVLRKTMLDDCKGERFEEVLSSFAMSTLRKTTKLPSHLADRPLSEAQLLPVVVILRKAVQSNIQARKEAKADAEQQQASLEVAESNLQERLQAAKQRPVEVDSAKQKDMRAAMNSNWIGEYGWSNILLHGKPAKSVLAIEDDANRRFQSSDSQALLGDLDIRIEQHRARLAQWAHIAKDLTTKQGVEKTIVPLQPQSSEQGLAIPNRFSKHKALNLSDWNANLTTRCSLVKPYEALLDGMRREIADMNTPTRNKQAEKREGSTSPSLPEPYNIRSEVPNSPLVASDSPQLPDEDSRNDTSLSFSVDGSTSIIASEELEHSVSPSPTRSSDDGSPWIPIHQGKAVTTGDDQATSVEDPATLTAEGARPPMSPSSLWMSLADRTRASMSLTGRQSILPDPDSPDNQHFGQIESRAPPESHPPSSEDRHATLLERTRMSMSLLSSSSASRQRKPNKPEKRISQTFPINQFETPGRTQPRHSDDVPESGSSTPRDQLFEEEADYTSVFKSRPKLAMSPALSPDRRTSALGSILEQDVDHIDLNSDEDEAEMD